MGASYRATVKERLRLRVARTWSRWSGCRVCLHEGVRKPGVDLGMRVQVRAVRQRTRILLTVKTLSRQLARSTSLKFIKVDRTYYITRGGRLEGAR